MNTAVVDKAGVRAVAVFEAAKGLLVLLTGFAMLSMVGHDVEAGAEAVVGYLHLNPAHELPRIFLETASQVSNSRLQWLALFAGLYSLVRFVEAFGLWNQRKWAEWFAIISCCGYLPFEVYELTKPGHTRWKLLALSINLLIVGYLLLVLRHQRGGGANRPSVT